MRVMAYLGTLLFLVALWGAWMVRRKRLEHAIWFQRAALTAIAFPFFANFAGWILTEAGRQPWVVYGLLKTEDAVSGAVSTWTVALSLAVFVALYTTLGLVDFYLMRRYARLDPRAPGAEAEREPPPQSAPAF
jgi:cytochrome d ubiquinol oxidase subunit I